MRRRLGLGSAILLTVAAIGCVFLLGSYLSYLRRTAQVSAAATRVLRPGMTKLQAKKALRSAGLGLDYGKGFDPAAGQWIQESGLSLFPSPGFLLVKLKARFAHDRLVDWRVEAESARASVKFSP